MKVLVVVDMQNDFITGSLGTPEARAIVPRVAQKIREFDGGLIALTQDTHFTGYLNTLEGENLPIEHCRIFTDGWRFERTIKEAVSDRDSHEVEEFEKNTFGSVELCERLAELDREQSIESVELVGLCTDICVISNALMIKAFLPETPITVDASCCAGVTPESHRNALRAMEMCQIKITGAGYDL